MEPNSPATLLGIPHQDILAVPLLPSLALAFPSVKLEFLLVLPSSQLQGRR